MHLISTPSAWVTRFASLVPNLSNKSEVLDLACGTGRHARLFASLGYRVVALDRDADSLAQVGQGIEIVQADIENGSWPLVGRSFSGIVVTNYLHRPLFPVLISSLAPGGVLIYETFAQGNERFGKPSNPNFLLAPGELIEWMRTVSHASMRVIAYEDGYVNAPKPAMVQRLCAVKQASEVEPSCLALD